MISQERVFLVWIKKQFCLPGEAAYIALQERESVWYVDGDGKTVRREWGHSANTTQKNIRFVFCLSGGFPGILTSLKSDSASKKNISQWHLLFCSEAFEVWEWKGYFDTEKILPLRFGLSDEERYLVLRETRRMLGEVLRKKQPTLSGVFSSRFSDTQTLDIAVWTNGHLRASVIVENLPCSEALTEACYRIPRDNRFKPLAFDELAETRIEITFMSDLVFPITYMEYEKNEVDPTKGYLVHCDGRKGWYLPEVHNVVSFSGLREFLEHLAIQKAGLRSREIEYNCYGKFEVFDWIEGENEEAIVLRGPIEAIRIVEVKRKQVQALIDVSVQWLTTIQESDGNIPAVLSANHGVVKQVNWVSLGCAGYALAVYALQYSNVHVEKSARDIVSYIEKYLPLDFLSNHKQFLALVYYMRLQLILGKSADSALIQFVLKEFHRYENDPLTALQALSLFAELEHIEQRGYRHFVQEQAEKLLQSFEKKCENNEEQLALYPEIVALFNELWQQTQDVTWKKKALDVCSWYAKKQQSDGSFPHSPGRSYAYVRGTGKIFEVLACFPEENRDSLEKAFLWLDTMQYTKQNTFWTASEGRSRILGGFRHDVFNQEAWIDGAAHVILGGTRFLQG